MELFCQCWPTRTHVRHGKPHVNNELVFKLLVIII